MTKEKELFRAVIELSSRSKFKRIVKASLTVESHGDNLNGQW